MDLTTCRRCGMDVEASATTCPNCGVVDPGGGGRIISPAALAILGIVGVLFVLIMTTDLGPAVAKRWFPNQPTLAQLARARGDSMARVLTPATVHELDTTDLRSVATADSTIAPATIRAARLELASREAAERRRVGAEQKRAESWRINSIASDAKAYTFSDGSACRNASVERATRLVRAHEDWSNQDLIKVICKAVWVGMSADQLRAAWGNPQGINQSSTGFQQWVYGTGTYVYLQGSLVTSWQTFSP
jgi:hypothetical protein